MKRRGRSYQCEKCSLKALYNQDINAHVRSIRVDFLTLWVFKNVINALFILILQNKWISV